MTILNLTTDEQWKDIPGYSGYQVSNYGRVISYWHRVGTHGAMMNTWRWEITGDPKLLGTRLVKRGHYRYVTLQREPSKQPIRPVHQLVLEAFVGPRPDGQQARHLDDDKSNNTLANLAWGTKSENLQERTLNGRNPANKLNPADVQEIRKLLATGMTQQSVADIFHLNQSTIARINSRQRWGYI